MFCIHFHDLGFISHILRYHQEVCLWHNLWPAILKWFSHWGINCVLPDPPHTRQDSAEWSLFTVVDVWIAFVWGRSFTNLPYLFCVVHCVISSHMIKELKRWQRCWWTDSIQCVFTWFLQWIFGGPKCIFEHFTAEGSALVLLHLSRNSALGIFPVYLTFHSVSVVWNLGLKQNISSPSNVGIENDQSFMNKSFYLFFYSKKF